MNDSKQVQHNWCWLHAKNCCIVVTSMLMSTVHITNYCYVLMIAERVIVDAYWIVQPNILSLIQLRIVVS